MLALLVTAALVPVTALGAPAQPAAPAREGVIALLANSIDALNGSADKGSGDEADSDAEPDAPDPSDPDPGPTPEPEPEPEPEPDPEPDPEPEPGNLRVDQLFLKWSADYDGMNEFVGEDEPIEVIEIMKKGQRVQLNAYYLNTSGDGVLYETANSDTELGTISINWTSSDTSVATVDPRTGLVTPRGNGEVTIKASVADPDKYGAAEVSVNMIIDGQEGEYVDRVEITDDAGEIITNTVHIESDGKAPEYRQLHAIIYWVDADGNPLRKEYTGGGSVSTSVSWETGGSSSILYVNKDTGRVATQEPGIGSVICSVAGGVGGRTVSDTVHFFVDTGQDGYNPADSLTLNFSYENYPDQILKSITFSLSDLSSNLTQETHNYTVIAGERWATIRAQGYRFIDVLNLANQRLDGVYVSFDDILQFRFGTADAYDAPVSASYLFGSPRYYYPDYDIGFTSGAVVVPPLLATASNIYWNSSYVNPNDELGIGTRFRLVFGVTGPNDANTSRQVFYINTINIVVKGAPPESFGGGDEPNDNGGSGGNGSTGPSAPGSGSEGQGDGSGSGAGSGSGSEGGTDSDGNAGADSGGGSTGTTDGDGGSAGGAALQDGPAWRYYQTMVQTNSLIKGLEEDNPVSPFTAPACAVALIGGGASMFIGYRRRLY